MGVRVGAGFLCAAGAVVVALAALVASFYAILWLAALLALAAIGLLFERFRYKEVAESPPGPPWEETQERFVDPRTRRLVTVWYHPRTGRRMYVAVQPPLPLAGEGGG